ncbi:MAG TPA: hypothetical protein VK495_04655 [Steroidobacteraceae bacterium]|nr:hypothetical protein [Steroidobacteraceae bacterium]
MCDSRPYSRNLPAPGALAMRASGDGFWELDLADGSAFNDLRPIVSPETWDMLLRKMRAHPNPG